MTARSTHGFTPERRNSFAPLSTKGSPVNHDDSEHDSSTHDHHNHDHDHEHGHDQEVEEALEEALELDTQSQIFLEMRRQNLDLLRIATQVAGYQGEHGPLKSGDVKNALRNIWEVFSEFYNWVDPEEAEGDDEEGHDDDEE